MIAFVSNDVALSVWVNFGSVGVVHHVLISVNAILQFLGWKRETLAP